MPGTEGHVSGVTSRFFIKSHYVPELPPSRGWPNRKRRNHAEPWTFGHPDRNGSCNPRLEPRRAVPPDIFEKDLEAQVALNSKFSRRPFRDDRKPADHSRHRD